MPSSMTAPTSGPAHAAPGHPPACSGRALTTRRTLTRKHMKGTKYVSAVAVALLLAGCSKPVLDWRNAEVNNGLVYAMGENEPFTGNVTNIPREQLRKPIAAIES